MKWAALYFGLALALMVPIGIGWAWVLDLPWSALMSFVSGLVLGVMVMRSVAAHL